MKIIDIVLDDTIFNIKNRAIIVSGPSQGGGLSLMVSAITSVPIACLCDVPSDCQIDERIKGRYGKYGVLLDFISDFPKLEKIIYDNMSYFDVVNVANKISCPIFASIGKLDEVCPGRFFMEAYKKITSYKELVIYDEYGHGGYTELHFPKKLAFIKKHFNY